MRLASVLSSCLLIASASAETWQGEKVFNESADIAEPIVLDGSVMVQVAAGKTVTVPTVVSGEGGSITKTGGGTLLLTGQNTFTGGVILKEGFLTVKPVQDGSGNWIVNSTALGKGALTICGQTEEYTGDCQFNLYGRNIADANFTTTAISIANDIHVTGNTTETYPAIVAYYQNAVLTGKVTADHDFYFYDDFDTSGEIHSGQSNRGSYVRSLTFGDVEIAGTLAQDGNCRFDFAGTVTAAICNFGTGFRVTSKFGGSGSNRSSHYHFQASSNVVGEILVSMPEGKGRCVYLEAKDALPNTLFHVAHSEGGQLYFAKLQESVGAFSNDIEVAASSYATTASSVINGNYPSGGNGSLVITGVPLSDGETVKYYRATREIMNLSSLTLDAYKGFTQEFAVVSNRFNCPLNITRGTLRFSKGACCNETIGAITCGPDGCLEIADDATEPAFRKVTTLAAGGVMTFGVRDDFPSLTSLTLVSNSNVTIARDLPNLATFDIESGSRLTIGLPDSTMSLDSLWIDGKRQYRGRWTNVQGPLANVLSEGSVLDVKTGAGVSGISCSWTGAGADDLLTTAGNWASVPTSLTEGTAKVTLNGGTGMAYAGSKRLASITDSADLFSFAITNVDESSELMVDGDLLLGYCDVTLRGIIASAYHLDHGTSTDNSGHRIQWKTNGRANANKTLTLDGACVEKPLRIEAFQNSTAIAATEGSCNVFKGHASTYGYSHDWLLGANSVTEFANGFSAGCNVNLKGSGKVVFSGPYVKNHTATGLRILDTTHVVFAAPDCTLQPAGAAYSGNYHGLCIEGDGAKVSFTADHAFTNGWFKLNMPYNSNTWKLNAQGKHYVCLNATTQAVDLLDFGNGNRNSLVNGEAGALIEVKICGTNHVNIAGAVGFHQKGSGTLALAGRSRFYAPNGTLLDSSSIAEADRFLAYESTGPLMVSAGRLELWEDASWLNGTDFTAKGTGVLKFASKDQVNGRRAWLHIADNGKVYVPEGVTMRFAAATLNGKRVDNGVYPKDMDDSTGFSAHIEGGGSIRVCSPGLVMVVL